MEIIEITAVESIDIIRRGSEEFCLVERYLNCLEGRWIGTRHGEGTFQTKGIARAKKHKGAKQQVGELQKNPEKFIPLPI